MRPVERLVIVGVGLVGGSLAAALAERGLARNIVGVGRSANNLERALGDGLITESTSDLVVALEGAELVILATPVGTALKVLPELATAAGPDALISDVGSVKGPICALAEDLGIGERFVGGHPLAGGIATGALAARAGLFEGADVVLCRAAATGASYERIAELWQAVGARVSELGTAHHDRALAVTSHLPQLLASALALTAGRTDIDDLGFAGPALDEMTRVAASDTEMWRQICRANQGELSGALGGFAAVLTELSEAIERGDDERLAQLFEEARLWRQRTKAK